MTRGGEGVQTPPKKDDIICEQPLMIEVFIVVLVVVVVVAVAAVVLVVAVVIVIVVLLWIKLQIIQVYDLLSLYFYAC